MTSGNEVMNLKVNLSPFPGLRNMVAPSGEDD